MHDVNDVLINGLVLVLRCAMGMRAGGDCAPATDADQTRPDQTRMIIGLDCRIFMFFSFVWKVKSSVGGGV